MTFIIEYIRSFFTSNDKHTLLFSVPEDRPLPAIPAGITERRFFQTPSGPLELHVALPSERTSKPPLLFVHGGFGSAECYQNFLPFFAAQGYSCYAVSLRGHGHSFNPGYWALYFTPRQAFLTDLAAAVRYVREDSGGAANPIVLGHSSGGGLTQDLCHQGLPGQIPGVVLLAAIPGNGSLGVNANWLQLDRWFLPRFFWHWFHPRSPLSSTALVHRAFFSSGCSVDVVKRTEKSMSEFESMSWPMLMQWQFVDPAKVINGISGEGLKGGRKMLIVAADDDKLMGVKIEADLAAWYREANPESGEEAVKEAVVLDAGHHFLLDTNWREGAEKVLDWLEGK